VVRPLELLVRRVAVLVPVVVLLGDAEVDERATPEVSEAHAAWNGNAPNGTNCLVRPEDGAYAHQRCALLGCNPVVLAGAHRELAEPVLAGELPQTPEI